MIRAALVLVLVALVIVLGARLVDRRPADAAPVRTPNDSDYYLLGASIEQMDTRGRPEYRMTVAESLHYPDRSARLTDIHVDYFGEAEHRWVLDAGRGRIPAGEKNILLHDSVEVIRDPEGKRPLRLRTRRAWVRPEQDQVDTDVTVQITAPGQQTTGRGMRIDLNSNRITLNHDVRVRYQPAP